MAGLETVKLPLKLAQQSGLDQGAFNGCTNTKFNTIEFDLNNVTDLRTLDASGTTPNAITALTNIYKMFAASGNDFTNNDGDSGLGVTNNKPAAAKWWLPQNIGSPKFTPKQGSTPANFTSTLNGITWKAEITPDDTTDATDENQAASAITTNTQTVTITGTLPTRTTGGFKYKYTNGEGNGLDFNGNNQSQTLPSNITTIKIVLNKKSDGR